MAERGPTVLIVGGLMTSPPVYWALRRRLLRRGASRVAIAPVFGLHWLVAAFIGLGPATSIVARAIERLSDRDGGRPILVIGHSGGGILVRLALAGKPFDGARRARPGAVGAVVTLGAPHSATHVDGTFGRQGRLALRFLARHGLVADSPEASPAWLAIGSTFSQGRREGRGDAGRILRGLTRVCYVALLGPQGRRAQGDGMVPLECAFLPGAERIELRGFAHAPLARRWYGTEEGLDQWWDRAVAVWRRSVDPARAPGDRVVRPVNGREGSSARARQVTGTARPDLA